MTTGKVVTGKVITGTLYRIQRGHGRSFIAAAPRPAATVSRPARVAVMLALAHKLAAAIAAGRLRDQADAARQLGVTRARITQLLALCYLAPDVQQRVLFAEAIDGREPITERALRHAATRLAWHEQRAILAGFLQPRTPI